MIHGYNLKNTGIGTEGQYYGIPFINIGVCEVYVHCCTVRNNKG